MEAMPTFTKDQIEKALGRLERGLDRYLCLQRHVRSCDVSTNVDFQTGFNGFYKVRRDSHWRSIYFTLMESAKGKRIEFPEVLTEISRTTGRLEASFASKLVATLDPSMPVIDKFVLKNFALQLPRHGSQNRELKTIELYHQLCTKYCDFIQSPTGAMIRELFDSRHPNSGVSELKKIDLVLWQIRP
jgi:hypothetical protein